MTRTRSWPALAVLVASLVASPRTQDDAPRDPQSMLLDGDRIAVEHARRTMLRGPAAGVDPAVLVRILRSPDWFRRAAAAAVLLRHGAAADAVATWLAGERDPLVLQSLVAALPADRLDEIVRMPRALPYGDDVDRQDAFDALRAHAFGRLVDEGLVDTGSWRDAIAGADDTLAATAIAIATEHVWPFPLPRFDELPPRARSRVLEELGGRPRDDVGEAIDRVLADPALPATERFFALTAKRSEDWSLQDLVALVDAALAEDHDLRHAAEHASWLVSPSVAGRIVGEVHRRLLSGVDLAPLLDLLRNVDDKGERHLVALARELDDARRDAIVEWLSRRSSPRLATLVGEALDGEYPLTPALLRRASPLLVDDARAARVRAVFLDPAADAELRLSAFDALCNAGRYDPGLVTFVLANRDEQHGRLPMFLRLPFAAVPDDAWVTLLDRLEPRAAIRLIGELVRAPLSDRVTDSLLARTTAGLPAADAAIEACLRASPAPAAKTLWDSLDPLRRLQHVTALRLRGDSLAKDLLFAEPIRDGGVELRFARIALGDRDQLDALLADLAAWEKPVLRRLGEVVPQQLDAARLGALAARFDSLAEAVQPSILAWIVARPDLDDGGLAWRIYEADATDLESERRMIALRGVLARPQSRELVRARLEAAFVRGLDDVAQDEAYELIGQPAAPIDAATTTFLARFLLVEPLARPRAELGAALRLDAVPHEPRAQLAFQRLVRESTPHAGEAFATAAREAFTHQDFAAASAARLLRLLEILAREPKTRTAAGAPIARLVLALDDDDGRAVGPAHQILAEEAEASGSFDVAAGHWTAAARGYRDGPPAPLVLRAFLGEGSQVDRLSPSSWLVARAPLCRARARLAAGDRESARRELDAARPRAFGDARSEAEVRTLAQELSR